MERRVSIVKLINSRSELGARLREVDTWPLGLFDVIVQLRKFSNEMFLECHIDRHIED